MSLKQTFFFFFWLPRKRLNIDRGKETKQKDIKKTTVCKCKGSFPHVMFPHISHAVVHKFFTGVWDQVFVTSGVT